MTLEPASSATRLRRCSLDPNDLAGMPGLFMFVVMYGCGVELLPLVLSPRIVRWMGGVRRNPDRLWGGCCG